MPVNSIRSLCVEAKNVLEPVSKADTDEFLVGFYKRHSNLRTYRPTVVRKEEGAGPGGHPEARQSGDIVWLYPKFWKLPKDVQDFVFAHEIGHWVLAQVGLSALIALSVAAGLDLWNTSKLPYGQPNMEEAFAEVFAEAHLNSAEFQRKFPAWGKLVRMVLAKVA